MTRSTLFAAVALLAIPAGLQAQAAPAGDPVVGAMRANWRQVTGYITAAAEEMTEADYAYKPTASVRTFGELIGHVAGAQFMMCAAALGEPARAEDAIEKSAKTKAALVAALKESTAYCAKAYGMTSAALAPTTQLFGQTVPRAHAIMLNAVHNGEHYGNIITYMRMKGMVPPSSRQ
jgi:uncharacterized damage-inducible protein DinB